MRLHRASDYRRSRWKNGKGETLEIAVHPPSATLDNFDWRISVALLEANAEFSLFPGIDRTIAIIDGGGVVLHLGYEPHRLDQNASLLRFAGDGPARAELTEGSSADLNVMTRRGVAEHAVRRLGEGDVVTAVSGLVGIFAHTNVALSVAGLPVSLAPWDMIDLSIGETASIVSGRALEVCIDASEFITKPIKVPRVRH